MNSRAWWRRIYYLDFIMRGRTTLLIRWLQDDFEEAAFLPMQPIKPCSSFGKRCDGADELAGTQLAFGQFLEAHSEFNPRSARASHHQFTGHYKLEREFDLGRQVAYQHRGAAFAKAIQSQIHRRTDPHRFEGHVGSP